MATCTYAKTVNTICKDQHVRSARIGVSTYGMPFSELHECILVGTLLTTFESDKCSLSPMVVKQEAFELCKLINVSFDFATYYDHWYQTFLTRDPALAIALEPENYPSTSHGYKAKLERLQNEHNDLLKDWSAVDIPDNVEFFPPISTPDPYTDIPNEELDNYVGSITNNQLVWRQLKADENVHKMRQLYANFLFNAVGFVVGLVVGATCIDFTTHFRKMYIQTLQKYNVKRSGSNVSPQGKPVSEMAGCSFQQEIANGLRIHTKYVFSLKVYCDSDTAIKDTKTCARLLTAASCSFLPDVPECIVSAAFVNFLRRKLHVTLKDLQVPYDPLPMLQVYLSITDVIEASNDPTDIYYLTELHDVYKEACEARYYIPIYIAAYKFTEKLNKLFENTRTKQVYPNSGPHKLVTVIYNVRPIHVQLLKHKPNARERRISMVE